VESIRKSMKKYFLIGFFLFLLGFNFAQTQRVNPLNRAMESYLKEKEAKVGVVVTDSMGNVIAWVNGNYQFPMQSVFKFHIAMVVLAEVDKGTFTLDQKMVIKKSDLKTKTWSPIRDLYPKGTTLTLAEIIDFTVSQSDNNGCDYLLKLIGGPQVVEDYFREKGYPNISIQVNEAKMHKSWNMQYKNLITPAECNRILYDFHKQNQQFLSVDCKKFLLQCMLNTETGMKRLKGKLPEGTPVAHKTGSSGSNANGVTAAANDVGIVFLPNRNGFIISVFVSQSTESEDVNEEIIANLCLIAWEYFNPKE
jgi:beta-lactamase class A